MTGKLGKWQGAGLLATTLLGTSVFILPQMTIAIAGDKAIWSWVLLTLFMLPVALVFARLAAIFPHAGGPANFVELAFGKVYGQSIGLIFLLVVPLGGPAALIMTYQFIDSLLHLNGLSALFVQYGFLLVIYALNIKGVSVSAAFQLSLTLVISAVVLLLTASYFGFYEPSSNTESALVYGINNNYHLLFSAAALAFWSFLGIEAMAHLSADFKRPKQDLVPAIIIGTLVVGLIYIACTFLVFHTPSTTPLRMIGVFNTLLGGYGEWVIGVLGVAGGIATVNVYTASCSKLMWSFSQQAVLPGHYNKLNRYGSAHVALRHLTLLMALIITITHVFDLDLEILVGLCNGVFVLIYLASMLAAFKLLGRRFRLMISLGCLVCGILAISLGWQMIYALVLISVVSPILKWRNSKLVNI